VIHFSTDVAIIFLYYYFNDFFYIYKIKKIKIMGGGSATPLGHMGVAETTPIWLGGGSATPIRPRGGSATPVAHGGGSATPRPNGGGRPPHVA
jgi:hypothetical protein